MTKLKLTEGERYGRLVYVKDAVPGVRKNGMNIRRCLWQCDCGTEKVIALNIVRRGASTSCGCYQKETTSQRVKTHGSTNTPEYSCWGSMRDRCLCENNQAYKDYGGRGIAICERWSKFENFLKDMGKRPSKQHGISRLDNDKGYFPENCKWELSRPNNQNTRASKRWHILGITFFSSGDAALLLNIPQAMVCQWCDGRFRNGKREKPKPGCYSYPVYSKEKVL